MPSHYVTGPSVLRFVSMSQRVFDLGHSPYVSVVKAKFSLAVEVHANEGPLNGRLSNSKLILTLFCERPCFTSIAQCW